MSPFKSFMKDSVFIQKAHGRKLGPYNASVSPELITLMEKALDVDEGDHVLRSIPGGKEETYLVLSADYSQGLGSIPPSYALTVRKTTALAPSHTATKPMTVNITNSSGFQVGDYNTQNIQATFNELIQKINSATASEEDKAEAKGRLSAFLQHPLVTSLLGGAAGGLVSLLGGS